jgi:hypothetical protein
LHFSSSFNAPRRAGSRGTLQSARFLGLARNFDRALIRKIKLTAPYVPHAVLFDLEHGVIDAVLFTAVDPALFFSKVHIFTG